MANFPLINEETLLMQVAEGDEKAFRQLFEHYWKTIYGVAFAFTKSPQLAEELTQDIFLKIWVKKEMLLSIKKIDSYLYVIAKNHIFNELRKRIKEVEFKEYLQNYFKEIQSNPEQQLIFQESEMLLKRAVNDLPQQQQIIYRLSREEGLSQEEIAEKLNISKHTVKSHMNKALRSIREFLLANADGNVVMLCIVFILT